MFQKLSGYILNDEKPLQQRILNLMIIYDEICGAIVLVIFLNVHINFVLPATIIFMMAASFLLAIFVGKTGNYKVGSAIMSYMFNLIVFPMFFIFGGGIYSGMPMLFVSGYILTFLLLSGISLIIANLVMTVWYIFVMTYIYYNPDNVMLILRGTNLLIDFIICFTVAAVVPCLIVWIHTIIYKKHKESILESRREIETTGQIKSRFLANMSHELRTPMNAILGMAELVERDDRDKKTAAEIALIKESAYSLLTTINNVLTYSKIDSGKMHLIPVQYHFNKMLQDIIYTISMEIADKNIEFYVDVDPQIPELLYGDDTRVRQVFQYILFNAIRNTDGGRIIMTVGFTYNEYNNCITLNCRISDTGMGMADSEQESIFKSYETYDSRKDSQLKKIGLELTICRDILKMMKGDIVVDSIYSVGTSISFHFDSFVVERTPIVPIDKGNRNKILVYTTHRMRRGMWTDLLSAFGIVPEFAETYTSLDARLKEKKYTHVFLDDYSYDVVKNLLTLYSCEEYTYVATDYLHVYGDFGKCRILRKPVYCLNLQEALDGSWDKQKYHDLEAKETFSAPNANILIVDDNMVNLKVAAGILGKYQINVSVATGGREALEKVAHGHFDMILLDQMMPEIDGFETLRRIRNMDGNYYKELPIICMTATIGNEVRNDLLKAGFQEYLAKPIKIRYLEDVLHSFLPSDMIIQMKKDSKQDNKTESTRQIPSGLQKNKGLAQVGGDESVYMDILNTYYKEGLDKLECIPQEFSDGDISLFTTNVHSVKGSSASIGALEVAELFKNLEMAGRKNNLNEIEENMPGALKKFEELLEEVKKYLEENGRFDSNSSNNLTEMEQEEINLQELLQFRDDLARINLKSCENILAHMMQCNFGHDLNEKVKEINHAYGQFDYHMVRKLTVALLEKLNANTEGE